MKNKRIAGKKNRWKKIKIDWSLHTVLKVQLNFHGPALVANCILFLHCLNSGGHSTLKQQHTLGVQSHFQDMVCKAHKTSSVTVHWCVWHQYLYMKRYSLSL